MKLLIVTPSLPSPKFPRAHTFIQQQIQSLKDAGLDLDVLILQRSEHGPLAYLKAGALIKDRIKQRKPDIIHIMYGGVMAAMSTAATRSIPTVVSFCGTDILGIKYGSILLRLRTYIGRIASQKAAILADGIIVKSKNLKDQLPISVNSEHVWIVPNGIDTNRFKPLGHLDCTKTLGWDVNNFNIMFSTSDETDIVKRLKLAQLAVGLLNAKGIKAVIKAPQNQPHSVMPIYLNAADVMLMTSRHEGSPNIIKEALACNRPVVSLDVGDVAEQINGIKGCYIATEDPADIARCLELVYNGDRVVDGRTKMEKISLENVAKRLIEIYETVIESKK